MSFSILGTEFYSFHIILYNFQWFFSPPTLLILLLLLFSR